MNTHLIHNYWNTNRDLIVEKSLANCHAMGVDSILFDDTPGRRIRLFVAHKNHTLWKNCNWKKKCREFSVAFHPHHCDITIHCVQGKILNLLVDNEDNYGFTRVFLCDKFLYQSKIKDGKCHFEFQKTNILKTYVFPISTGQSYFQKADEIHSVYIHKEQEAAWFIYEGKEDPNYKPYCWSNADLTKFDTTGMYEKRDEKYWRRILTDVFNRGRFEPVKFD